MYVVNILCVRTLCKMLAEMEVIVVTLPYPALVVAEGIDTFYDRR